MPNIKSAKKRVLVSEKKTLENKAVRTKLRNTIKKYNDFIDTLKIEDAEKMLPELMSVIDESVVKGVIHKKSASRKISRLSARLDGVKSGKITIHIKKDNKTIAAEKAQAARAKAEAARAENMKKIQERAAVKSAEKKAKATATKKAEVEETAEPVKPAKKATTSKKKDAEATEPATEKKTTRKKAVKAEKAE